ncbi:MAG: RNA methyltransferase [Rhodobacteraceae bacterium]|nr:RNA methyltransferase [Paracoccaceae bacterium]
MIGKRHGRIDRRKSKGDDTVQRTIWLFGLHAVDAALRNPARIKHRLVLTRNAASKLRDAIDVSGLRHEEVDARKFTAPIDRNSVHQGAALEVSALPEVSLEAIIAKCMPSIPVILLDRVTDPHNVGAIIRSVAAFGAAGIVVPVRHAPPETGALAKSASGALECVAYVRVRNLTSAMVSMRSAGISLVGFNSGAERSMCSVGETLTDQPVGLVFGSEGAGLRAGTKENCDFLVRIGAVRREVPLNVSNAAAIALHSFTNSDNRS